MTLNIKQRFGVVGIYLLMVLGIGFYFSQDWQFIVDTNNDLNAVLIATGLALLLSTYITEPYFSKPVDVIARWIAIFLFIVGLNSKESLSLYNYWLIASAVFTVSSLLLIFLHGINKLVKIQRIAVDFICKISRPEIVFTLLYFDIVISFFRYNQREYPILIGFGFLLVINQPVIWLVKFISSFFKNITSINDANQFLGQIIGHESRDLYKVEIQTENPLRKNNYSGHLVYLENITFGIIGIVLSEKVLLGKKWLEVLSLRNHNNNLISFSIKSRLPLSGEKSIFSKSNAVYLLNLKSLDEEVKKVVEKNLIYSKYKDLIGYVWEGSMINKIKFKKLFGDELLKERGIGEGSIIQTVIAGSEVLYQIIDAKTNEKSLEHKDSYGFTIGTAQKLGKYDEIEYELNTVKWLPEIYTPIFLLDNHDDEYNYNSFIGRLPNTNYGIPIKNITELVTHNTAILGILGIGKSCLTFELIQKLLESTDVKLFCIDLTFQYINKLPDYISSDLLQDDFPEEVKKEMKDSIKKGNESNSDTWGNIKEYKEILEREIQKFCDSDKRILILNPDWHPVEKPNEGFKKNHNEALTVTQKTRIISERIFIQAKNLGETVDARYLLVFEEAHSLVPEWNSASNDGDANATNGTAKVILQGRKYGLGSFVIAQRTANISKSILNQCNTIFALRIFDDTGKQFLENYVGSDYSNVLSTLEERHCVAIGKALKLKQPVILELNHMDKIKLEPINHNGNQVQ